MKTNAKSSQACPVIKTIFLVVVSTATAVSLLLGQGNVTSGGNRWQRFLGWEPSTPPPLILTEAYGLALDRVGTASNRFYCVSASCLEMTNHYFRGWSFVFSNTNGDRARVEVSFDKELRTDPHSRELLGIR